MFPWRTLIRQTVVSSSQVCAKGASGQQGQHGANSESRCVRGRPTWKELGEVLVPTRGRFPPCVLRATKSPNPNPLLSPAASVQNPAVPGRGSPQASGETRPLGAQSPSERSGDAGQTGDRGVRVGRTRPRAGPALTLRTASSGRSAPFFRPFLGELIAAVLQIPAALGRRKRPRVDPWKRRPP